MEGLWVSNDPTPDGVYRTTIVINDDFSMVLNPDRAIIYARTFIDAGIRAVYDAAVYAQLTGLGIGRNDAGRFITDLRQERPPLDEAAIAPLRLEPGVNSKGVPFVGLYLHDKPTGQMDAEATMNHGRHVLEVVTAADYDASYLRMLKGVVGVSTSVAQGAVSGLREEMEKLL